MEYFLIISGGFTPLPFNFNFLNFAAPTDLYNSIHEHPPPPRRYFLAGNHVRHTKLAPKLAALTFRRPRPQPTQPAGKSAIDTAARRVDDIITIHKRLD